MRGWAGAQGGRPSGGEEPGLVIPLATEGTQQLAEAISGGSEAICFGGPFCLPFTILHWYSQGEVHAAKPSHLPLRLSGQKDIVTTSYSQA